MSKKMITGNIPSDTIKSLKCRMLLLELEEAEPYIDLKGEMIQQIYISDDGRYQYILSFNTNFTGIPIP